MGLFTYASFILYASHALLLHPAMNNIPYTHTAVITAQENSVYTIDTFSQTKPDISAITLEIKENGKPLGVFELDLKEKIYHMDEWTIEVEEYVSYDQSLFINTNQITQPAFRIKITKEGYEETSVFGEGFFFSQEDVQFELELKDITYVDDLAV